MPKDVRAAFLDPRVLHTVHGIAEVPRARLFVKDFWAVLAGMDEAGMLDLIWDVDAPRGFGGEDLGCGMFAVAKSATEDRMITDRRPANSREFAVGAVRDLFPHGSQVGEICLEPEQILIGHGDDLPHYYFTIKVSDQRARYNQIGPSMPTHFFRGLKAHSRFVEKVAELDVANRRPASASQVRAVQTVLPMGDRSATDFGHIGHLNVLRAGGGGSLDTLVSYRSPFPAGPTHEWVCVDDHIITQIIDADEPRIPGEADADRGDVKLLAAADKGYAKARLRTVDKKRFRGQTKFDLLGARVDGEVGLVAAKPGLLLLFLGLAQNILCHGRVWGRALATAVGLLSHALLFRREGFSVLDNLYREVRRLSPGGGTVHKLSAAALDELAVMACLMPLLSSSLRAEVSSMITCSDASGGQRPRGGVTKSEVRPAVAQHLWRHRMRKPGYLKMEPGPVADYQAALKERIMALRQLDAWDEPDPDFRPELGPRFFGDISDAMVWQTSFGFDLKGGEHINMYEHRVAMAALLSEIRRTGGGKRLLLGCDSDVVCGVIAKGRSSSRRLNKLQRKLGMQLLFSGCYPGMLRTPTSQNTADAPSRRRGTRHGVASDATLWAKRYVGGDLEELEDRFPRDHRERWCVRR
ncbi:MAG TPA: hypothetical protein EYQ64_05160 [Gemmatimonadetes bacterium]|nr:hypothetical protein [Gemmatimonadota bacterium]